MGQRRMGKLNSTKKEVLLLHFQILMLLFRVLSFRRNSSMHTNTKTEMDTLWAILIENLRLKSLQRL